MQYVASDSIVITLSQEEAYILASVIAGDIAEFTAREWAFASNLVNHIL